MKWTKLLITKEHTIATLEFVDGDNQTKRIKIYAFNHRNGDPAYYNIYLLDDPIKDITEYTEGSFDDAVTYVKGYVKDMGCDDTIENEDAYKPKASCGDRLFFIADGVVHDALCKCICINYDGDCDKKMYTLWISPNVVFFEELLFLTKEDAERHLGIDKYDIGKLGLLMNGNVVRDFFDFLKK